MQKIYVKPEDLRLYWDYVRKGLLKILSKTPEGWIPEDVYVECFNNKALLWAFSQDNRIVGFSVLQPQGDNLHIWCSYFEHNLDPCWQALLEIAKAGGASTVTFDSHRKGWDVIARKYGFRPRQWIKDI
jgi:hypothetical protein